jgi:hypothetical protein
MAIVYTKEYIEDERAICAERASQYANDVVCELREAATKADSSHPVSLSKDACNKVDELCRMLIDTESVTLPSYGRDCAIDSRGILDVCLQDFRDTVSAEVGVDVDVSCAKALGMCEVTPENASELEEYVHRIVCAIVAGDDDASKEMQADVSVEVVRDVCHWLDDRIDTDYLDANVVGLNGTAAYGLADLQDVLLRVADDYERLRYEAVFGSPFENEPNSVSVVAQEDTEMPVNNSYELH